MPAINYHIIVDIVYMNMDRLLYITIMETRIYLRTYIWVFRLCLRFLLTCLVPPVTMSYCGYPSVILTVYKKQDRRRITTV